MTVDITSAMIKQSYDDLGEKIVILNPRPQSGVRNLRLSDKTAS